MRRFVLTGLLVGVVATPAFAQQSLNFLVGGFTPRAEDARTPNDVLVNDLTVSPQLSFNISDFNIIHNNAGLQGSPPLSPGGPPAPKK